MKMMMALALLIGSSHAFAGEIHELSCNSDKLTVDTFVSSVNGIDQLRVALVDDQGRTMNLFGQASSGERADLQAKGLKLSSSLTVTSAQAQAPETVIQISGNLISLSGQINDQLQCIDLRSDNPWGKNL